MKVLQEKEKFRLFKLAKQASCSSSTSTAMGEHNSMEAYAHDVTTEDEAENDEPTSPLIPQGSSRSNQYPIGIIPPHYVYHQSNGIWTDNGDGYKDLTKSGEILVDCFEPFLPQPLLELSSPPLRRQYPIGVIPPHYVYQENGVWTPPPVFKSFSFDHAHINDYLFDGVTNDDFNDAQISPSTSTTDSTTSTSKESQDDW